jgi:hypothetical protein
VSRYGKTHLYRLFNAEDRLLYVGISGFAPVRIDAHRRGAPWGSDIARREVEEFPTRRAAAFAESEAINTEFPLHNKQGRRAEPKSAAIARAEAASSAKKAACRTLQRDKRAADAATARFEKSIAAARLDGHSFREIGKWANVNHERARTIAIRINGDSRTRAEREAEDAPDA